MAVGNSMGIGIPMVNLGLGGGGGGGSFLLDDYPNTNGHSYSLRQLSSTITNVVRVRRATDNTEQDFTATQITDGTLATFCGSGDGFVAKWYDQSGSNDVLNFTALQQPKIFAEIGPGFGGVLLQNGKPCMEFDGVDDSLQALIFPQSSGAYYLFAVNTFVSGPGPGEPQVYMYGLKADVPAPFTGNSSIRWNGLGAEFRGSSDLSFIVQQGVQSLYYARQQAGPGPFSGSTIKVNQTQNPLIGFTDNGISQARNTIVLGNNPNNYAGQNSNIKLQEFILYLADPGPAETPIQVDINTYYSVY